MRRNGIGNTNNVNIGIAFVAILILLPSIALCASLFDAIALVESTNGRKSGNVYQIQPEYVADVNRIQRKRTRLDGVKRERFTCDSVYDRKASERMMDIYWGYYCPRIGSWTDETKAKLHRVGYKGMRTRSRLANEYWKKVEKCLVAR